MKKFAICCLAFAAVLLLAQASFAVPVTTCYHLTYFCDGVQGTKTGARETLLWDWVCLANGTGQIGIGPAKNFGTYPLYPFNTGTPGGFAASWQFKPLTATFNLYGTTDGMTWFFFQKNSPFTTTAGPCSPLKDTQGLRPATIR